MDASGPSQFPYNQQSVSYDWASSSSSSRWVGQYWDLPAHAAEPSTPPFAGGMTPFQPLPRLIAGDNSRATGGSGLDHPAHLQHHHHHHHDHSYSLVDEWPPAIEAMRKLSISRGSQSRSLQHLHHPPAMSLSSRSADPLGGDAPRAGAPPLWQSSGGMLLSGNPEPSLDPMNPIDPIFAAFGDYGAAQDDPMLPPETPVSWHGGGSPSVQAAATSLFSSGGRAEGDSNRLRSFHHYRRRSFSSASLSPRNSLNGPPPVMRAAEGGSSSSSRNRSVMHRRSGSASSGSSAQSSAVSAVSQAPPGERIGFTQLAHAIEGVNALRQLPSTEIRSLQPPQLQQALNDVRLLALLRSGFLARRPEFNTSKKRKLHFHQMVKLAQHQFPPEDLDRLHAVLREALHMSKHKNPARQLLSGLHDLSQQLRGSARGAATQGHHPQALEPGQQMAGAVERLSAAINLYYSNLGPEQWRAGLAQDGIPAAMATLSRILELATAEGDALAVLQSERQLVGSIDELCALLDQNAHIRRQQQAQERNTQAAIANVLSLISQKKNGDQLPPVNSGGGGPVDGPGVGVALLGEPGWPQQHPHRHRHDHHHHNLHHPGQHPLLPSHAHLNSLPGPLGGMPVGPSATWRPPVLPADPEQPSRNPVAKNAPSPEEEEQEQQEEQKQEDDNTTAQDEEGEEEDELDGPSDEDDEDAAAADAGASRLKPTRASAQLSEHRCKHCSKVFAMALGLKRHMRNHTGEKPFQCEVCGARFSQKSSCKRHLRTHTGVRPFECPICGRGFSQRSNQQRHLKTHSKKKKAGGPEQPLQEEDEEEVEQEQERP